MQQPFIAKISKWKLHRFYAENPKIRVHLPQTAPLTPASLNDFLNLYGTVYVKASTMHLGSGVIKVWRAAPGFNYVVGRGKVQVVKTAEEFIGKTKELAPKEQFIVQRAINLATFKGSPYDIRVMMMRDKNREWQFAGMLAKVHGRGSVVSNVQRGGGYVIPVQQALSGSKFSSAQTDMIQNSLINLSRAIMAYSENFPFYSFQSGIDLGVDRNGRIWIIEVNLHRPSHLLFKKLQSKTYYNRIRKLYKDYREHNTRII